jgi:hypothetical protein
MSVLKTMKSPLRTVWAIAVLLLAVAAVFTVYRIARGPAEPRTPRGPGALVGRWERPDGGYVLQIDGADADGTLRASYFNPKPIHVAQAEWRAEDGWLQIFIELRDVNYPGSTYTLTYDPVIDELLGTYYQAVMQQSFDVRFARAR